MIPDPLSSKRVAAYCRVSTDKSDQANSLDSQQRYFKHFIGQHPTWELYDIFADEGASGTSILKRKAFKRMLRCAENNAFDMIITKEISRFARNTLDSIYYTRYLKSIGIGVLFLNDNINTLDADAELRLTIMSSIAQEESRKTSERVKWGQKRRMEQGVVFGRSLLGYDVADGKITVNPDGAKIVRLIFDKYVREEKGTHTIAKELQAAGISPMYASHWSPCVILKILKNEKYCGDLIQKKTYTPDYLTHQKKYNYGAEDYVILKNHHQPIISADLFIQAKKRLQARSGAAQNFSNYSCRYPLSGKIKCGICSSNYVARRKKRKDGTTAITWRCLRAVQFGKQHGCPAKSISNADVLSLLRFSLNILPLDKTALFQSIQKLLEQTHSAKSPLQKLTETQISLDTIYKKQERLLDLFVSEVITETEFNRANNRYRREAEPLHTLLANPPPALENQQEIFSESSRIHQELELLLAGQGAAAAFYESLLHKMVLSPEEGITLYLKHLPLPLSFRLIDK